MTQRMMRAARQLLTALHVVGEESQLTLGVDSLRSCCL